MNSEPQRPLDALLANLLDESADHTTDDTISAAPAAAAAQGPQFTDLGLNDALIRALKDSGYTNPTEVQLQAIPAAMAGRDVRVASSTGSGKTAAFMLPSLERIAAARGDDSKRREKGKVHGPRVLVLTPTRELALQVAEAACTYGRHMQGLRVATVVGGVPYGYQLKALRGPLDVLIATPGRLIDHLRSGVAVLSNLEVLVLDEADRMLDMGFIEDIETIAEHTPAERQTMMFSATFAGHVGKLAERLTRQAQHIEVTSHTDSHDNIEQRLHLCDTLSHKNDLLDHLLTTKDVNQAVVFTSTQRDADILADRLADMGHAVAALHGGMPQGRRNRVLQGLRSGELRVLVATDVAARGIDVPTITHVINYGMPMKPEDYVHRIGRTGRAGRSGLAVTLAERRDIPMLRRIERYTTQRIAESTIAGLEPRTKMQADRTGPRTSKPMPGQRGPRDDRWSAPRSGGFSNDGPRAPRQDSYDRAPRGFQPGEARFGGPQGDTRGGPSFDRGGDNRPDSRAKKPWDAPKPFGDRQPARFGGGAERGDRDSRFAKPAGPGGHTGRPNHGGGRPAGAGPSGPGTGFGKRPGFGKRAA